MTRESRSRILEDQPLLSQVRMPLVVGVTYIALVIVITLALSFPGIGVALLPQPFLDAVVLGKTVYYDFVGARAVLWVPYVVAIHATLYLLIAGSLRTSRAYVPVSILIYIVNMALVLGGLADEDVVRLVNTYTIGYAGVVPGIGTTLLIEWSGYRLARRLLKVPASGSQRRAQQTH